MNPLETEVTLPCVQSLTPEQVSRAAIFFGSDEFEAWRKAVIAEEFNLLNRGVNISGRKLIETVSLGNRRWKDEAVALKELKGVIGDEALETKIKSPAQIEKALVSHGFKKKDGTELISKYVERPENKSTTVVSESDARPSIKDKQTKALDML
jgi:hypothetical protein